MKKIFFTLTALLLLPAFVVKAQVGITAVPFLQIEPDSRATGMGNTGVAVADNASAIFWNPAGLAFQNQNQISVTHANWLPAFNADLFYDYLVGTYYVEDIGTIGGHITFLNLGEQIRTDETGLELGRFNSFEISAGLSYGFRISDNFSLGTGLRYIYSSLADGSVSGQDISPGSSVGIDLAALYKTNPFQVANRQATFNAGFNLSNIGPGIQYTDNAQKDPLPTVMRLGWAYTMDIDANGINTLTLSNDISKIMARNERISDDPENPEYETMGVLEALFNSWGSYDRFNGTETVSVGLGQQLMYGFGLEYWYDQLFALRTGYYYEHPENGNREFITLGAGLRYNIFGVDFSYIYTLEDDHPLANTIRLSVLMNFR
ncbi:type IX secretion system outer membrane channel protein PorV [Rhodohalobacter sp. 614A]|uniref:type IX secretion system outer membrane channel protein PorV n=1 Tax=Rhodohalobacter sp. 614A TaxID=2908649 RepID=UPI001F238B83|nr:type IX secretion system outer membrane channel protein PorV [Rhodohalobacter sp. 614A]